VRATGASAGAELADSTPGASSSRPLLTVVVPVYNGGEGVVGNVEAIGAVVREGLPHEEVEVIVVSDGSIDGTAERLLETRGEGLRVIHYDRNLGKGYAVKAGSLPRTGDGSRSSMPISTSIRRRSRPNSRLRSVTTSTSPSGRNGIRVRS
jgi:Glycosyl transferase family 2